MSNKTSGADLPDLEYWTRAGLVRAKWGPYESFESLVFDQMLAQILQRLALGLLGAQDFCAQAKLPWRRGALVFGEPGTGKSASSRAIALLLSWRHLTIPAAEIFDAHHLLRALHEISTRAPAVVVLDNLDQMLKRIDPSDFFEIFDHASERIDGVFWIATSKRPEELPKNQLLRPGRFEEAVRLTPPNAEIKKKYYETYLEPFFVSAMGGQPEALAGSKTEHISLLESNPDLTFAHLQEMRLLVAKVLMDGSTDNLVSEFELFAREQTISGDRSGGLSVGNLEVAERVRLTDPRLLISALHVTDAFKKIVEATVSNASEALAAVPPETKG